jgi:predicted enzyme related to lactoylglutathione lyase
MRNVFLASTVALLLAPASLGAATKPADVGSGHVAWFDLTTTDLAKSRDFYGRLLDWTFAPLQGTDQAVEIVARKKGIGTLRLTEGTISAFNGVIYVQVNDLPAKVAKAKELGATVVPGFPFDLLDGTGAIALLTDPSGHPVGLYSRAPLPPAKKAP